MKLHTPDCLAYLVIPHLPVAVERRERPRLRNQPVVIAGSQQELASTRVMDCSPEALAEGVRPGMAMAQAERLCPGGTFLPPRLDLYRATTDTLLDLLQGQVPLVEQAQLGGAYLGLHGLARQGDEVLHLCRQWGAAIVSEIGLVSTAGVAANKFSAEAASLSIGLNRALVLTAGTERSFLSDFPVALLPVGEEIRRRLNLFGLRQLGQFARLPSAAVLAQFGWEGQRAHRLARGEDDRPLVPGRSERCEAVAHEFEPPLDSLETLVAAAGQLVTRLAGRLAGDFLRAGQVDVLLTCVDGATRSARRVLAEPTADAGRLARLVERMLRDLRYPERVSELTLVLNDLAAPSLHQLSLWQDLREVEASAHLARLAARYGPNCFRRSVLVEPEHRLAGRRFVTMPEAIDSASLRDFVNDER